MNTSVLLAFVVGLLVGWLVEWAIDWFYWRRKCASEIDALKAEVDLISSEKSAFQEKVGKLENEKQMLKAEIDRLEKEQTPIADLDDATMELASRSVSEIEIEPEGEIIPDKLTQIRGVGPVIEKKLNEAGIFTFSQLGKLSPVQLEEIVGEGIKRLANEDALILQAQILAGDLVPDTLTTIKGIGPVIEKKLNKAGIYTFVQLGDLTAEKLEEIVGEEIKRLADEDELLRQAKELAAK